MVSFDEEGLVRKDRTHFIILAIVMAVAVVFISFLTLSPLKGKIIGNFLFFDHLNVIPIFIISAFCGHIPGLIISLISVFLDMIDGLDNTYGAIGLFATVIIAYLPARHMWYKSISKTVAVFFTGCFFLGIVWPLLRNIVLYGMDTAFFDFQNLRKFLPGSVAISFFCVLLTWIFANRASDSIKEKFYTLARYTVFFQKEVQLRKSPRKRSRMHGKVSLFFTVLVSIVALVGSVFIVSIMKKYIASDQNFTYENMKQVNLKIVDQVLRFIIVLAEISIPTIIILNYLFEILWTSPIKKMSVYMKGFARTSDENRELYMEKFKELKSRTHDEVGELYHSVELMMLEINMFIDQMQNEQKLSEKLESSIQSNRAKSDFLSNMSHEIRTPINAILGMDEMILRESKENAIVSYAKDIKNSGKTLLSLVNDILDFSKMEAGKMKLIPVRYELSKAISEILAMLELRIKEKNLQLIVNVSSNIPKTLYGDEMRIKQIFMNLMTNAVKYTERGSIELNVGCSKIDDENIELECYVKDTGIGIKEKDLDRLRNPFERVDEERNRTVEGSGLGMTIVTQLLTYMDSRLEIESQYEKGSKFSFKIKQKVIEWTPSGNFETTEKGFVESSSYYESFHAPEAHLLFVDDTLTNLKVIQGLLKPTQCHVDICESGFEMLDLISERKYDIIFIDHRMPGMDGIEALHAMKYKKENKNKGVPAIALTANAIAGARDMYIEAGFNDYISKPVDPHVLETMIMKYLPEKLYKPTKIKKKGNSFSSEETSEFEKIQGVDISKALVHCGSAGVLREAIKSFYEAISRDSEKIRTFYKKKDWENYTICVHALKSAARLVGAEELSDKAFYLEKMGDERNVYEIQAKTQELLELYESYHEKFRNYVSNFEKSDKELIGEKKWNEAIESLRDFAAAFDWTSIDMVFDELKKYKIPDEYKEKYEKIREFISIADRNALLFFLEE